MTPLRRGRALIWVRLALTLAVLAGAVIVGSTPDPISRVELRAASGSAPTPPPPVRVVRDAVPAPPTTTTVPPTTTTTRPPPPPTTRPPAPRRPTATVPPPRAPAAPGGFPAHIERWRSFVAAYPGWNVNLMLLVIDCESDGNPNAINSIGAAGLFQHYPTPAGWRDPGTNTALAHSKWSARGMQPWAASRYCWTR